MDPSVASKAQVSVLEHQLGECADEPLAQKLDALQRACALGMQLVAARPNGRALLDWRDPLPESTVAALARLRAEHRAKR
jgi:hypothetical protein